MGLNLHARTVHITEAQDAPQRLRIIHTIVIFLILPFLTLLTLRILHILCCLWQYSDQRHVFLAAGHSKTFPFVSFLSSKDFPTPISVVLNAKKRNRGKGWCQG
jgi:hypothetical protein